MWAIVLGFIAFLLPQPASARLLEIIHTNDLHSHFDHSEDLSVGGYAALRATMDSLRERAAVSGVESLVVDAGDFTEGTPFFLAENGAYSWELMNALGYDVVAIGNHEWLGGTYALNQVLGIVPPNFAFVGANFKVDSRYTNIRKDLKPYTELERAGISIAIIGLTTNDALYSWRVKHGHIESPIAAAQKFAPVLKRRNQLVIALTHLGVSSDMDLASKTTGIDLIIGGHSHTRLQEPVSVSNPDSALVPIVQAGKFGEVVGDLLIDVEPEKPIQILRYALVPVPSQGSRDPTIENLVKNAEMALNQKYGRSWLDQVIGRSEVAMEKPSDHLTPWAQLVDDAIREVGKADLSLNVAEFYGDDQPAGEITREQILRFYPRIFSPKERYGWTVWTTQVEGWVIKYFLGDYVKQGYYFDLSGGTFDIQIKNGQRSLANLRIGGKKLRLFHRYTIALPEGIGRAIKDKSFWYHLIFRKIHDTRVPIWQAIEDRFQEVGGVVSN